MWVWVWVWVRVRQLDGVLGRLVGRQVSLDSTADEAAASAIQRAAEHHQGFSAVRARRLLWGAGSRSHGGG